MTGRPGATVVVALRVSATPQRAFDVFTREIGAWWRPNPLFQFTPGKIGRLAIEAGEGGRLTEVYDDGTVFEIGRITAWEPGRRLAFDWRQASFAADQRTRVEIRFEAVGEETRVTVEHRGWDQIPQEHAARHGMQDQLFLRRHGEWWQSLLIALGSRFAPRP